ncbi:MAG: alpha/beta hydrolase [Taibaiella sp.]|nr:alpha/beta hydrolase [Taibaiella sp.]
MSSESGYVRIESGKLHYLRSGNGKKILLAFHGYGNSASLFSSFTNYLGKEYTIISIDLPYHGKSEWSEKEALKKKDIIILADHFTKQHHVEKISLLGYSIGGKVCLSMVQEIPEKIDKVLLIASAGLIFEPFFHFVTRNFAGRKLFTGLLTNPKKYLQVIDWLKNRKLIAENRYRFVNYVQSEESRKFLLRAWPALKNMVPDQRKLKAIIRQYRIPICIFMGKYDKIIPADTALRFQKGLDTVSVTILPKGHRVFDAETLQQITNCLL